MQNKLYTYFLVKIWVYPSTKAFLKIKIHTHIYTWIGELVENLVHMILRKKWIIR